MTTATTRARTTTERGAALVEYALLMAMVALTTLAAVRYLGAHQAAQFASITAQI